MKQKYIVWSFDPEELQTFADIVSAANPAKAKTRVAKERPYAIFDQYVDPILLSDHIADLQRKLASTKDNFSMIDRSTKGNE